MAYRRLGDYIKEVNVRNNDLEITNPMGINIDKYFMPSVANVIGTDLSTYKLVNKNQFACNLMHVGRDERIPMALHIDDAPIIVSPAYFVFEIIQNDILLPEYLMIWFRRPEFDRNAWFYTDADVRGGLSKEAFLDMSLPIPSIEEQRKIVAEYQAVEQRIENNNRLIKALEDTAQAIYHHTFVENIDPENLPEGWKILHLEDVCEKITDGVHNTVEDDVDGNYYLLSCKNIKGGCILIGKDERRIDYETFSKLRKRTQLKKGDILLSSVGTIGEMVLLNEDPTNYEFQRSVAIIRANEKFVTPTFLYYSLKSQKRIIEQTAHGAVQSCLFISDIANLKTLYPPLLAIDIFTKKASVLIKSIYSLQQQKSILVKIQSLLLSKLS